MGDSPPRRPSGSVRLDFAPGDVSSSVARLPARLAARWSNDGAAADRRRVSPESSRAKQVAAEGRRQAFLAWVADKAAASRPGTAGRSMDGSHPVAPTAAEAHRPHPPHFACPVAALRAHHASRRLARAWRGWRAAARTTAALAAAFAETGVLDLGKGAIGLEGGDSEPTPVAAVFGALGGGRPAAPADPAAAAFDADAGVLQAPATLAATRALLRRLDARTALALARGGGGEEEREEEEGEGEGDPVPPLLARLRPPRAAAAAAAPPSSSTSAASAEGRYPARPFLAAFMIVAHPAVVFRGGGPAGDRATTHSGEDAPAAPPPAHAPTPEEAALSGAAADLVGATRALLDALTGVPAALPPRTALATFDAAWVGYLTPFAAWKAADAAALEADLVAAAAAMEGSRAAVVAAREAALAAAAEGGGATTAASLRRAPSGADVADLSAAVDRDLGLLRDRVATLGGPAGLARMEAALVAARAGRGEPMADPPAPSPPPPATAIATIPTPPLPPPTQAESLLWSMLHAGGLGAGVRTAEALWEDAAAGGEAAGAADLAAAEAAVAEARSAASAALPAGAAARASAALQVARAEDGLKWARVEAALAAGGDAAVDAAAAGLASAGAGLAACLGDGPRAAALRADVAARLDPAALVPALRSPEGGLAAPPLLDAVDWTASVVRRLCAPARDAAARAAHAAIAARLGPALASGAPPPPALLASALRISAAAVRLLQADVARAEAALLVAAGRAGGGGGLAGHAARLFTARAGGDGDGDDDDALRRLAASLPLTRSWLADAVGRLPVLEGGLPAADAAVAAVPADLRAGRVAPPAAATSADAALGLDSGPPALQPAPPGSWRRAVRVGLVGLAAARTPVIGGGGRGRGTPATTSLPETLALDALALSGAQHAFQLAVVCAAGALLVAQHGAGGAGAGPEAVRARLRAALGDPAGPLPDVGAELARLATAPGLTISDPDPALVATMQAGLSRLLRRGGAPFKALAGAVEAAIVVRLLCPPGGVGDAAVRSALARAGAGAWLVEDVDSLAAELAAVAAVGEAVHGRVWEAMVAEFSS